MPEAPRVTNISNGHRMKLRQARRAIENCAVEWVVVGSSVRSLTVAESRVAAIEQAKFRVPLEYAEVHGLKYEPPPGQAAADRASRLMAWEASLFVDDVISQGIPA